MGSLRNPIGPLPSSIYWRRRAVALSLVALLLVLVVWALNSGAGSGGKQAGGGSDNRGDGAASAITPGPTSSEPVISERPGGRDEEDGGADGDHGGTGDSAGTGGGSGDDGSNGTGGSGGSAGSARTGGTAGGGGVPAADLPTCTSGPVKLRLVSVENEYAPGEKPKFKLIAENGGGDACKVDFGPKKAVITISDTNDDTVWASDHCPAGSGSALLRVPARGEVTHTVEWDRKRSAAECATPSGGSAKTGTYLAEAAVPGLGTAQTSFVLTKD
ncbi:hypothetical protein [Streptomyces gobiensis]|uniref:hypothetical protein n=1 Tax=Streptomyces gobiensis TaxID=2875706 RepID=UPI001E4617F9|nr:hypothetical protein [Streptomyces gobiensis]UGY92193.1 hypothetical protein test1122_10940 [Streptomyces gobiensis]